MHVYVVTEEDADSTSVYGVYRSYEEAARDIVDLLIKRYNCHSSKILIRSVNRGVGTPNISGTIMQEDAMECFNIKQHELRS